MIPRPAAAIVTAALVCSEAAASGFAIREQSGSFQGLSFAGVAAGGADISTMYFNPATLSLHTGTQANLSLSYIVPSSEFRLDEATDPTGAPITGGTGGDIATNAVVPATYAMISSGALRFGLGVTAPFGLRTEQPNDWVGRYHATESDLKTININPAIAYQVSDRFSLGAGFVAQYADATLANALFVPGAGFDPIAKVEGDDWDFGFTLGALAEPLPGTRIGIGYRSQINHSLDGERTITTPFSVDTVGGRAALSTPQVVSLGVRQRVTGSIDVLGTVEWTGWSSFDELRVSFDDGSPDSVTPENWEDTWFFALGAEYRPREDLTLQAGAAFDQTPIQAGFRTPRIPGNDRTWLSLGAAWTPREWLTVGAGYSRIFVADGDVDLVDVPGAGTLRGSFDNGIDILTLHASFRF